LTRADAPIRTETFSVWSPLLKASAEHDLQRLIEGLASSERPDQQGETILQKGIDVSPLRAHGHINWNHRPGPEYVIGEPVEILFKSVDDLFGLFFKGLLYKGIKAADDAWTLLKAIDAARAAGAGKRALGWSVEGGVVERDPDNPAIIRKSIVRHMALTHEPVNTDTYVELVKSWGDRWTGHDSRFDPDTNAHYSFVGMEELMQAHGVGSLRKTMAANVGIPHTADMAVVIAVPSLGRHATSLMEGLGEHCDGDCRRERRGRKRAYRHLVKCAHLPEDDAFVLVKALTDFLD
jgi:hypothetical protein